MAAAKTNATKLTKFLDLLSEGHTVRHACSEIGVGRSTVYDLRESDEAFSERWNEAEAAGVQVLEQEARRRAVEGVEDFKMAGDTIVPIRRYSDTLLIFLLKAKRPGIYREHFKHEHSSGDGKPLVVKHELDADSARGLLRGLVERGLIRPGDDGTVDATADEVRTP